tara:strand:+ start:988 stop:1554 length:567 start_codon:yes stop_codon:yes gene_type:complete
MVVEIDISTRLTAEQLIQRYMDDWSITRKPRKANLEIYAFPNITNIQYLIAIDEDNKIIGHSGWGKIGEHYIDAGSRVSAGKDEMDAYRSDSPNYREKGIYSKLFNLRSSIVEPLCDSKKVLFIITTKPEKVKVIKMCESRGYALFPDILPEDIVETAKGKVRLLYVYVPPTIEEKVAKALRRLLEVQ